MSSVRSWPEGRFGASPQLLPHQEVADGSRQVGSLGKKSAVLFKIPAMQGFDGAFDDLVHAAGYEEKSHFCTRALTAI